MKSPIMAVAALVFGVSTLCSGSGSTSDPVSWNKLDLEAVDFTPDQAMIADADVGVLTSALEFNTRFGSPAPSSVDWSSEWVAFHTTGAKPVPGNTSEIASVQVSTSGQTLQIGTELGKPDPTCTTLLLERAAFSLVAFPSPGGSPTIQHRPANLIWRCSSQGLTEDTPCHDDALCDQGLVCAGVTRGGEGICRPDSQRARDSLSIASSISAGATKVVNLHISGIASVDEDVVIDLEITHPSPADLHITLENPSGNVVDVWANEAASPGTFRINRAPNGFSGDEDVNGIWQLRIDNDGASGQLHNAVLEVTSRHD